MVLRNTLVDTDIPRRERIREAIVSQWRDSFGQLKSDLSVGIWVYMYTHFVSPLY
jgi:hypothetical protein